MLIPITVAAAYGSSRIPLKAAPRLTSPEGEGGHQTNGEQIAETIASQAETDGVEKSTAAVGNGVGEGGILNGEKQRDCAGGRSHDRKNAAEQCPEQQPGRGREHR